MHKYLISISILILICSSIFADSPLTSTDFHEKYLDIKQVQQAKASSILNLELATVLCSPDFSIDLKAALINALGWDINGKANAELFKYYLGLKYQKRIDLLKPELLTADELFSLGYLSALDNYFSVREAEEILKLAALKNPKSQTVQVILSLVQAQGLMDRDWCLVWQSFDSVISRKDLSEDLRKDALNVVFEYMVLYKEHCTKK